MDAARYISDVSDAVETTAQVTPIWFDLSDAEQDRVHKNVEGHLLGRESANSTRLNFLSGHIRLVHETGTTSPTKTRFSTAHPTRMTSLPNGSAHKAKIFAPAFRRPAVKQRSKGDLKSRN
jgi:hypothetical protein